MTFEYDVAFLGQFTKDTISSASGTRTVAGGAFNYGAHVAARMGLRTAAVTQLAEEDLGAVAELEALGVRVFAQITPQSTCLRLEYPSADLDERIIYVTSTAGTLDPQQVAGVPARVYVVGASIRGEVPLSVVEALAAKQAQLALDVQGFVRVARGGRLVYDAWPLKAQVLAHVDIVKTDAVEAEMLTGQSDLRAAATMLADLGPAEVVLTHRQGLLVYAGQEFYEAGFYPREIVGRSGRGDTCLSAYTCKRLSASPGEATLWAAAVTSLKMEAEGPFRRDIREVEALLHQRYEPLP